MDLEEIYCNPIEPAQQPLHPKAPALAAHLKLKVIDAVKWNLFVCEEEGDSDVSQTVVLKLGDDARKAASMDYEIRILREVLPSIDQNYFERLVLPEYLDDGEFDGLKWVTSRYIKGKPLVYEWSELSLKPEILGGKKIKPKVADHAVDVLRDLRSVEIERLPDFVRPFKFEGWQEGFRSRAQELDAKGLLGCDTANAAGELFSNKKMKRYEGTMFTNGDFYPRNFIFLPKDKIAVVDWVGGIDPWEFVAMHAWLLMWGNPEWQTRYVKMLKKHFPIDVEEMQAGLLVRSFDQVYRWKDEPEELIGFARTQMLSYFRHFLDIDNVKEIFG